MEWDQYLFSRLLKGWRRLRAPIQDPERAACGVDLDALKPRLVVLASALAGVSIEIAAAEAEGGYRGETFFLPARRDRGPTVADNIFFYLFRVVFLSVQRELGLNWIEKGPHSLEASRQRAEENAPRVLAKLFVEYPMIRERIESIIAIEKNASSSAALQSTPYLWGKWMEPPADRERPIPKPGKDTLRQESLPKTALLAPPRETLDRIDLNKKAAEAYTLNHYFEKVETAEDFNGTWRDLDGSDDLKDHADALRELDMRQTVRTEDPVHSVYQVDFRDGAGIPESGDAWFYSAPFFSYPEWDYKRREHKTDFCKVFPSLAAASSPDYCRQVFMQHSATLRKLRKQLSRFRHRRDCVMRQSDGEDLDLDAVIAAHTDIRAERTPSDFLYIAKRKTHRDLSLSILIDTSLSTDAYEANQRVIDVEKEAIALLAAVLAEQGDRFEIAGFFSRTRNRCEYIEVKRFEDKWEKAAVRLGSLVPRGYTRIGPAIRHAAARLARESGRKRWILLLSDGKPGDYDRYEGRYGIEDVRQSVRDAAQQGIRVFSLAVQAKAKHYLPHLFGQGHFRILPRPELLPEALLALYRDLRGDG